MYTVRFWQEVGWTVVSALVIELAMVASGLHPEAITDWRSWAILAAGSLARAAGIAVLAAFGRARIAPGGDHEQ